jgi:hypothetical protein
MPQQKHKPEAGDARTPDKRIGEVAYADNSDKKPAKPNKADQKSAIEGPAAYAPHQNEEICSNSGDPAKKKSGEF